MLIGVIINVVSNTAIARALNRVLEKIIVQKKIIVEGPTRNLALRFHGGRES
jgi:hypothetical protein